MFYFGYMFTTLPYAFGATLLLYGTGRALRRMSAGSEVAEKGSSVRTRKCGQDLFCASLSIRSLLINIRRQLRAGDKTFPFQAGSFSVPATPSLSCMIPPIDHL